MIFGIVFIVVTVGVIIVFASAIGTWHKNNNSPVLTVDAKATGKRVSMSGSMHSSGMPSHSTTSYHVTFEVESGDRFELNVTSDEYALISEGDTGRLTFQGTRFLGFERMNAEW